MGITYGGEIIGMYSASEPSPQVTVEPPNLFIEQLVVVQLSTFVSLIDSDATLKLVQLQQILGHAGANVAHVLPLFAP